MSDETTVPPAHPVDGETPDPDQAANLGFWSFALLGVNVFMVLTGLYASALVFAIPVVSLVGLWSAVGSADAAGQGRRAGAIALAALHGLVVIGFLYRLFT